MKYVVAGLMLWVGFCLVGCAGGGLARERADREAIDDALIRLADKQAETTLMAAKAIKALERRIADLEAAQGEPIRGLRQ